MAPPDGSLEWGGELYVAEGFTEGAPYGHTYEDWLRVCEESEPHAAWARAKRALRTVSRSLGIDDPWIGRVKKIGHGLHRDVFAAPARIEAERGELYYAILLPRRDAPGDLAKHVRAEARLLALLSGKQLPFRVPRPIATVPTSTGLALVREFEDGFPVDLREGRVHGTQPQTLVAELAASVHAINSAKPREILGGPTNRRAHAETAIRKLEKALELTLSTTCEGSTVVSEAFEWAKNHRPADTPSCLLHGDLLGQNILLSLDGPPALIDWERAALGDAAYDLAIVTRGVRAPFAMKHGLEALVEAYGQRAAHPVEVRDVIFHEVCLLLHWCADPDSHTAHDARGRLRRLLRTLKS